MNAPLIPAHVQAVQAPVTRQTFDEVMFPTYPPAQFVPVRGQNARVWDQAGREYIDFAGGVAVLSLGHCHPAVLAAMNAQAAKLMHVSNWMTNEPALRLARKLTQATFAERVFLCNSGTEANEGALKTARKYCSTVYGEHKYGIVATTNSFHGRTFLAVSTGGTAKYTKGFGPVPAGISHVPYNDVDALVAAVNDDTACVILEPMQGEGGMLPGTPAFLNAARGVCNRHNALLIFDEIQSGMGRTGALFSYMQKGVVPDILTSAKGLGSGFPVGAFMTTAKIADVMQPGTHGSTYGGNPLASAVAEAVLDIVDNKTLLDGVLAKEQRMRTRFAEMNKRLGMFKDVRGEGLWLGVELNDAWAGKASTFMAEGHKQGVIVITAGANNILRFAPSLIIPDADIDEGLARLERACEVIKAAA
jgi:succinylornithine transaminase family protein